MVFCTKASGLTGHLMRYRNVEGVRMTEQTDRKHHNGNGNKKEHAHVAQGVGRVEPSTLQRKTQRKNTKRRHKTWVLRKPGFELKPVMSVNKGWNQRWKARCGWCRGEGGGGVGSSRRGKNPRQGESLDKDQRQNKQYNYEQARSTRHAGRPANVGVTTRFLINQCRLTQGSHQWDMNEVFLDINAINNMNLQYDIAGV